MEINADIYLFGSILFLIIAILVFGQITTLRTYRSFGLISTSGFFVFIAIYIFTCPYYKELSVEDYKTIVNLKSAYPEIGKDIDFALSDGKITIKEGADIWELTQEIEAERERLDKAKVFQDIKDELGAKFGN